LDPTMVGEVQAVIKDLTRKGLTMIIVTHEMRFAREVANRVFYMDEGSIYEDGTPEQIFDHPKKEKTARFVRRIKVLENEITSRDFDFIGFNSALEEFGRRSMISQKTIYKAQAVFEELCVQLILPRLPELFRLLIVTEYDPGEEQITMQFQYSGDPFDPQDTNDLLALKLAQNSAAEIHYQQIDKDGLTNRVTAIIR